MSFKKIDAPSIKELFLTQIQEMILSGELQPGDQLPPERELANTMGISKTIVHEGIRDLSHMGFLDVVSRKGVYVADYTSKGNLDTLFAMIRYHGGLPDDKMINDLLDIRLYLECPGLKAACLNRTPEDIVTLRNLQEKVLQADATDVEHCANTLIEYRRAICVLGGNCLTPLLMNAFYSLSFPAWVDYCSYFGQHRVYESLEKTTDYIEQQDVEQALSFFQDCVDTYKQHVRKRAGKKK